MWSVCHLFLVFQLTFKNPVPTQDSVTSLDTGKCRYRMYLNLDPKMQWVFSNDTHIRSADRTASYMTKILTSSFHNMKQVSYSPYRSIQSTWKDSEVVWFT
jgi:hypothetical protein